MTIDDRSSVLYASLTDERGTQRPTIIRQRVIDPSDLPAFLDHSVRYSLVDVWMHETQVWCENVLVPLYRMGGDVPDDPAPAPPHLVQYITGRRSPL